MSSRPLKANIHWCHAEILQKANVCTSPTMCPPLYCNSHSINAAKVNITQCVTPIKKQTSKQTKTPTALPMIDKAYKDTCEQERKAQQ